MDRDQVATSEVGEQVDEVLARAQREAAAIRARVEQEDRGYQLRARKEADRLVRRRAERLREARDSIRERSGELESLMRRFAEGLNAGTERVLWTAARSGRDEPGPRPAEAGRNVAGL